MTTQNTYENIQFKDKINTIPATGFPVSFSLHWHKYVEIIALPPDAIISSNPILRVNQTTYSISPGELLFIWPGELHETCNNKEKQLIGLQFSTTLFTDISDFASYLNCFRAFHLLNYTNTPLLYKKLMLHVQYILSLHSSNAPFKETESIIELYKMFMDFTLFLNDQSNINSTTAATDMTKLLPKINTACNYIVENCEQNLELRIVSDYIGFSTFYFSRTFKQATGYSFVEYLTLQRIKRAQSLLSDFSLSITEIAYQSGFRSISTFNRVFRQYRGYSPSEYRQYYSN